MGIPSSTAELRYQLPVRDLGRNQRLHPRQLVGIGQDEGSAGLIAQADVAGLDAAQAIAGKVVQEPLDDAAEHVVSDVPLGPDVLYRTVGELDREDPLVGERPV